jgi:hypothetical protein
MKEVLLLLLPSFCGLVSRNALGGLEENIGGINKNGKIKHVREEWVRVLRIWMKAWQDEKWKLGRVCDFSGKKIRLGVHSSERWFKVFKGLLKLDEVCSSIWRFPWFSRARGISSRGMKLD